MRQCGSQQLKPGMILGRPIYDQHYRKLLSEGVKLDEASIRRIQESGFRYIFIQESGTEKIKVEELIGIQCRKEANEALEMVAEHDRAKDKSKSNPFATRRKAVSGFGARHKQLVQRALQSMMHDLMYARQPVYFPGVYLAKDQLINHSTDVAILSMLIGIGFGLSSKDLMQLGKAALFHDVGKIRLDKELSSIHPLDRTEEQQVMYSMHPQIGAVLMEQDITTELHVTMAVLQHHELQDGSGFPEKLKGGGEQPMSVQRQRGTIHRFAEIIAVSNYFDNLVSGQVERDPVTPFEAIRRILDMTPQKFNPHIVQRAVSMINVFPEGSNVEVADSKHYKLVGFRGVVAKTNLENLNKPVVTLLYDSRRKRLPKPLNVDFAKDDRVRLDYLYDL